MELFFKLIVLLVLSVGIMLLLLAYVRHHQGPKRLHDTNDITGFYVTLLGALYGVFLGFMVLVVWTRFDEAETLVEKEAASITTLYVLAGQLHEPVRTQLRSGLQEYTHSVVTVEWDSMGRGDIRLGESFDKMLDLWSVLGHIRPVDMREQVLMQEAYDRMTELYQARRLRLLANQKRLPAVLWVVLIGGGIMTAGSTTLFGVERFRFHVFKTAVLTTLITLILYATWEMDQPFRQVIRVSADPYQRSSLTMTVIRAREKAD